MLKQIFCQPIRMFYLKSWDFSLLQSIRLCSRALTIFLQGEEVEQQTVEAQSDVYQTEDGVVFIQNPDGSIQMHGHSDQPIPLEKVQALLAMESEGQIIEQLK